MKACTESVGSLMAARTISIQLLTCLLDWLIDWIKPAAKLTCECTSVKCKNVQDYWGIVTQPSEHAQQYLQACIVTKLIKDFIGPNSHAQALTSA